LTDRSGRAMVDPKRDKNGKNPLIPFMDLFKPKDGKGKVEFVTVKEEKVHLKRVVKAKPMSRKHMAEALAAPTLTQKDIKITTEVIASVTPTAQKPPVSESPENFTCFQCGTPVPKTADRCPKCNALYLKDISETSLAELESAEDNACEEPEEVFDREDIPCIHFDAQEGIFNYLEKDSRDPDFMVECSYCGTVIEFETNRCPICGKKFDITDTGLVGLFSDMEFDKDCEGEIDCPLCGERVVPDDGKCPACGEMVHAANAGDPSEKVEPVIHSENVVFMHFDVETGELNYLQRLAKKLGFEQLTVQLESVGETAFEQDWKSLSRI